MDKFKVIDVTETVRENISHEPYGRGTCGDGGTYASIDSFYYSEKHFYKTLTSKKIQFSDFRELDGMFDQYGHPYTGLAIKIGSWFGYGVTNKDEKKLKCYDWFLDNISFEKSIQKVKKTLRPILNENIETPIPENGYLSSILLHNLLHYDEMVTDLVLKHQLEIGFYLDDQLLNSLVKDDGEWLLHYTASREFEVLTNQAFLINNLEYLKLQKKNPSIKSDFSYLKGARNKSAISRGIVKKSGHKERVLFALTSLKKNPTLSAKDIAKSFFKQQEKFSDYYYKESSLITYFQEAKRDAIKLLVKKN